MWIYLIRSTWGSNFVNPLIFWIIIDNKLFNKTDYELRSVSFRYIWGWKMNVSIFKSYNRKEPWFNNMYCLKTIYRATGRNLFKIFLLQKNWTPQELCRNLLWSENNSTLTWTLTSPRTPLIVSNIGSQPLINEPPLKLIKNDIWTSLFNWIKIRALILNLPWWSFQPCWRDSCRIFPTSSIP